MKEKCSNHPDREALGFCHSCRKSFCEDCLETDADYYWCEAESCRRARREKTASVRREPFANVASDGQRFANYCIDRLIFATVLFGLYLSAGTNFAELEITWAEKVLIILGMILYYAVFEFTLQKTPGKYVTNTKVVADAGSALDAKTIVKRTLIRFIPFEELSILGGALWHDRWCRVRVIKDTADKQFLRNKRCGCVLVFLGAAGVLTTGIMTFIGSADTSLFENTRHLSGYFSRPGGWGGLLAMGVGGFIMMNSKRKESSGARHG